MSRICKDIYSAFLSISTLFALGYVENTMADTVPHVYDRVQEKVYVHFDNTYYFVGDTIWYKAYVVNSDDHGVGESKVLYVDLLDAQGYVKDRQMLVVDRDGQADGCFCIKNNAFSGYYEVRAYTKWMMSFCTGFPLDTHPDNFFSRVFPIYEKPASSELVNSKIIKRKVTTGNYRIKYNNPPVNVRFYPEGGNLVNGVRCRVAYEAENEQGRRINIDGELLKNGNPTGQKVSYTHAGRGSFFFTPEIGASYSVRFESDGKQYTFDLPKAMDGGCSLIVDCSDDGVKADISLSGYFGQDVYAVFSCRGKVLHSMKLPTSKRSCSVVLPSDSLRTGVNMLSIISGDGMILCERMFFAESDDVRKANIEVASSDANACAPTFVSVTATDKLTGKPLSNARFSVAVRDGGQTDESFRSGENILTGLLLQSDLRGYIENPGYYFKDRSQQVRKALDELMLVQGWRRYDITQEATAGVAPETEMYVSGRVYNVMNDHSKQMKKPAEVYASIRRDGKGKVLPAVFETTVTTDSTDCFRFRYPAFYGNAFLSMVASDVDDKGKKAGKDTERKVLHDQNLFIRWDDYSPKHLKEYSWYEENKPEVNIDAVAVGSGGEGIYAASVLPGVEVSEGWENYMDWRIDEPVASYDFQDVMNAVYDNELYEPYRKFNPHTMSYTRYQDFLTDFVRADNNSAENIVLGLDSIRLNRDSPLRSSSFQDLVPGLAVRLSNCASIDRIDIVTDISRRPTRWVMEHAMPDYDVYAIKAPNGPNVDYNTSYATDNMHIGFDGKTGAFVNVVRFPENKQRHFIAGREIKLQGFNKPVEYYSPDYSKKQPDEPDYRKTLYWNPNVVTDKDGKAEIGFYNNSVCKDINVSIEAVTPDGIFLSY